MLDKVVPLIPTGHGNARITYNKYHIAVGTSGRHFIWFHPRKSAPHCHVEILLKSEDRTEWIQKLDEVGIFAAPRGNETKMRLSLNEVAVNEVLLRNLLARCEEYSR